ncbi:hypothetical protein ABEF92_003622 [Exophiala dermatitidis]|uniref:Uncharacterized protein n=1 Tax=Exophiala dermatitidis (strain ATCC 34100 / CBS 525.76 / NIH/UT8656) TaxID=858893 RepID=H6C1P9_EXODN|nr:uncharacterized protein HMPREF1120_05802 [Exophiala dermatitidis NIH/UT8656]EHY57778.1 hypothetical protein HMPREF1120_05802 [Exophiala dermatitidis NIH/UT8656]
MARSEPSARASRCRMQKTIGPQSDYASLKTILPRHCAPSKFDTAMHACGASNPTSKNRDNGNGRPPGPNNRLGGRTKKRRQTKRESVLNRDCRKLQTSEIPILHFTEHGASRGNAHNSTGEYITSR